MKDYGNRNGCVQWFFTFPRWTKYSDIKIFRTFFKNAKWGKVVMESHDEPDDNKERNSMIHYHVTMVLNHKMTKSQFKKKMEVLFPSDYKRIDFDPTKDLKGLGVSYLEKQELDCYEWGTLKVIPKWAQQIYDEWEAGKAERDALEKRATKKHIIRLEEIYESEHMSVYCHVCERVLPCEDHDGLSEYTQL